MDWKAEERKAVVLEREIEQHVQAAFETAKQPRLVSLYTSFQSYADLHGPCNLCEFITLMNPNPVVSSIRTSKEWSPSTMRVLLPR